MLKYAKIINEETKEVSIGAGTNSAFYQSIGMTEMEVEQDYNGSWYLLGFAPQKPLNELKLAKRAEINKARDKSEQGGFEYLGKIFDSDQVSAQRISMAAQAMAFAPEGTKITWTCQDNSTIDLSAKELIGLVIALADWSNTCHKKATELKSRIDACESEEELNKIVWDESNDLQIEEDAILVEEVPTEDDAEAKVVEVVIPTDETNQVTNQVEGSEVIEDGLQREETEIEADIN